jgi:hypothetical protein
MIRKIKRNAARCKLCEQVVESTHRHDFQQCECGAIFTDGGLDYIRRGGESYNIEDLTEYEEPLL